MKTVDIIAKKRDGHELTADELQKLVSGYVRDDIPDYQLSAFLMAVFFQGMTPHETALFTQIMRDSGAVLDLSAIPGFKSDKHSTGGVGDKVSLILAPLAASAGLIVPMMSGRALAHTGGTLDKLEAIPGFRTDLKVPEFEKQLQDIGVALIGQTEELCPADKKIYALRDATATVNAIPLITASILSKKMAEGIDALVLDVKAGSGAIFETEDKAWELARMLVRTAEHFSLPTAALITAMDQPLGYAIGNWLETEEAIRTLRGEGPADLIDVTVALTAQMLVQAEKAVDLSEAEKTLKSRIEDGSALNKFLEIVARQGGDTSVIEQPESYQKAELQEEISSEKAGYVSAIQCREIGRISMALGAGRSAVTDGVDYTSGIVLSKKVGDEVAEGEALAVAYSNNKNLLEENRTRLSDAFSITTQASDPKSLILGKVDFSGEWRWNATKRAFEPLKT